MDKFVQSWTICRNTFLLHKGWERIDKFIQSWTICPCGFGWCPWPRGVGCCYSDGDTTLRDETTERPGPHTATMTNGGSQVNPLRGIQ